MTWVGLVTKYFRNEIRISTQTEATYPITSSEDDFREYFLRPKNKMDTNKIISEEMKPVDIQ